MAPSVLESTPGLVSDSSSILTGTAYRTFVDREWARLLSFQRSSLSAILQRLDRSSRRSARPTSARSRLGHTLLLIAAALSPAILQAQNKLSLDTTRSEVHFTLTDTLHVVHGTFHIQQGDVTFDPATGKANGSILVDALSGQSGNSVRDHRMAKEELKAPDYKTVAFAPTRFTGTFNPTGDSALQVHGLFTLLGTPHEIDVPMQVQVNGDQIHAVGSFAVPYIQWGLKDPSTFMIKVEKEVHVDLDLTGTLRH
jgi:polyisoprenoid-binding protein YceI